MDAITLHQAGFLQVVASLGTSLTNEQAQLLRRQCSRVIIAYDADVAGREATLRGLETLVKAGCDVRVLQLPAGMDPDELVLQGGDEAFRQALAGSVPLTEFKIKQALERHAGAGNSAEAKARVIQEILPLMSQLQDFAVLQDEYVKRVAQALEVREEGLRTDLKRYLARDRETGEHTSSRFWNNRKVVGAPTAQSRTELPRPDGYLKAEREVLRLLLHHPHLSGRVQQEMVGHAWKWAEHAVLYQVLLATGSVSEGLPAKLMGQLEDPEVRHLAAELLDEARMIRQPDQELGQILARIRKETFLGRRRELRSLIQAADQAGQQPDPALVEELQEINRQLAR